GPELRDASLSGAPPLAAPAPNRSSEAFVLTFDFRCLDMVLHVLRAPQPQRIGDPDYATDGLKK
ncbi:MAG: hypothetical protein ACRECG_09150, partial [Bradyrhizobium sp.]